MDFRESILRLANHLLLITFIGRRPTLGTAGSIFVVSSITTLTTTMVMVIVSAGEVARAFTVIKVTYSWV